MFRKYWGENKIGVELAPIEYQRFMTWSTIQLAEAFGVNVENIKNNLKENLSKFTERIDYYKIEGLELKKYIDRYPDLIPKNKSKISLWTINGVTKHAEMLNTLSAWRGYKYLVDIYVLSMDLHQYNYNWISDTLKPIETDKKDSYDISNQDTNLSLRALKIILKLEEKLETTNVKTDTMASDIAIILGLYAKSNLPHCQLIGAIARTLKMPIRNHDKYEDDDIYILPDQSNVDGYWQVYYKPEGVSKIIDWFNTNKDSIYFIEYCQKDTKTRKRGEVKGCYYKVQGKRYWVKNYN